jgi:hypothetical protein
MSIQTALVMGPVTTIAEMVRDEVSLKQRCVMFLFREQPNWRRILCPSRPRSRQS